MKMLSRIRHWRGHGIHSPFVYRLVRDVFTGNGWVGEERGVYNMLTGRGVRRKTARQLQNLATHCDIVDMRVIMPEDAMPEEFDADTTFVFIAPRRGKHNFAALGGRLTIDTRRFFIIFNDQQMPHQHFRI